MAMPWASAISSSCRRSTIRVRWASKTSAVAPGVDHGFNGGRPDDRHVKSHILPGLADLDDGKIFPPCQRAGPPDGRIRPLHGFYGNDGAIPNYDGLADIHERDPVRGRPAEIHIRLFRFAELPSGHLSFRRQMGLEQIRRIDQLDPRFFEHLRHGADQRIGALVFQSGQSPDHGQIRKGRTEYLDMLHLACHDGLADACLAEYLDELAELPQPQPVDRIAA